MSTDGPRALAREVLPAGRAPRSASRVLTPGIVDCAVLTFAGLPLAMAVSGIVIRALGWS